MVTMAGTLDQGERQARIDLAAAFRLTARFGWHEAVANHFSLTLDPAAYAGLFGREVDREAYRERLEGTLEGLRDELAAGVRMQEAVCADVLILGPGQLGKLRREVVLAVIHARFRIPGRDEPTPPMTYTFLMHAGAWKLMVRN